MLLSNQPEDDRVRAILIGDSGSGKTGSLASLANDGYTLLIADFDNGWQPLARYVDDSAKSRISIKQYADPVEPTFQGPMLAGPPCAVMNYINDLKNWKEGDHSYGDLKSWGRNIIHVVDSGTFLGQAYINVARDMGNAKPGDDTKPGMWGSAQDSMSALFELFKSPLVNCHILVTFHIRYQGGYSIGDAMLDAKRKKGELDVKVEQAPRVEKGYPSAPGRALPPKVGSYFNTMLLYKTDNASGRRVICTEPEAGIDAKCPVKLGPQLDLATGLSQLFHKVTGHIGPQKEA